jgi:hypothetical protein
VVDEGRRPVAGARVACVGEGAAADTGVDGSWVLSLAVGGARRVVLVARARGRAAAICQVQVAGPGLDQHVPALVLKPAHVLRARVLVDGAGAAGARVAVVRREGPAVAALGTRSTGADGRVRFEALAAGLYEVYASRPGRGRGRALARLPQGPDDEARVELGAERVLDVRVLEAGSERPVAGAAVAVGDRRTLPPPAGPGYQPPRGDLRTDGGGRCRVRGLGVGETVYVNVRAPGYAPAWWYLSAAQVAPPQRREVVVHVGRPRTVRFPLAGGDVPAEGTTLRVETAARGLLAPAALSARIADGALVVDGLPALTLDGRVVAPDGTEARFRAPVGVEVGAAVTFLRARAVRVHVHEPDGTPVAGLALLLRPQETGGVVRACTDEGGLARFPAVCGTRASVHRALPDRPLAGPLLGRIDLGDEDVVHELEVPAAVRLTVDVRVDGEPGLPPSWSLTVGGQHVSAAEAREDPDAGTIEASVRPVPGPGPLEVVLRAEDCLPARAAVDAEAASEAEVSLDLVHGGRLTVQVVPPADGVAAVRLERRQGEGGPWAGVRAAEAGGAIPSADGDGMHAYAGLEDGVYRVRDLRTGSATEPVLVRPGGAAVRQTLDLRGATWVEGRVRAPAGSDLRLARVLVEGRDDPSQAFAGTPPAADGSFRLRALQGQRLTLRVRHPLLRTAAEGGVVTVTAGSGPVELSLVGGPRARFRVPDLGTLRAPAPGLPFATLRVVLYAGPPKGPPVLDLRPVVEAGGFAFGGYAPGRYTLWIGLGPGHAPYVRRDVALGAGTTDLGEIVPEAGATLRFDLRGDASEPAAVWASVTSLEGPSYQRHAVRPRDGGLFEVGGLGAGRFRVLVRAAGSGGGRVLLDEERELDGRGTTVLAVPLR